MKRTGEQPGLPSLPPPSLPPYSPSPENQERHSQNSQQPAREARGMAQAMISVFFSKDIDRDQRRAVSKSHFDEAFANFQDEGGLGCVRIGSIDLLAAL